MIVFTLLLLVMKLRWLKIVYYEQAAAIRLEIRGGEWKDAFMQMDGEPWKQPMSKDYSTFVDIKRVPHQSLVVKGDWLVYIKLIPSYHICQHCNCEWPLPHKKTYEQVYYDIIKDDQIGKAGFKQEVTKILEWMMSRWTLVEEHIWLDQ